MSQVTEQSVRFQTALASIKLIQASAVLDLTEDDFDFLTSNKVWIATDRSRARRCVEACDEHEKIGRAVQQECRDRCRMPSSACKKITWHADDRDRTLALVIVMSAHIDSACRTYR